MDEKLSFRQQVKDRLKRLGVTQKELAEKMQMTEPAIHFLLIKVSDTKLAREKRIRIMEILDKLESEYTPIER